MTGAVNVCRATAIACLAGSILCGCATVESLGSFATESSRAQDWPEGTLLTGEVIGTLSSADIAKDENLSAIGQAMGLDEAVVLTQFKQSVPRFRAVRPFGAVHAFLPKGLSVGNGDVVAVRRTQQGHVVIRVVEKREDSGDCFYEDRGGADRNYRDAVFCHSLRKEVWRWVHERYFVKLPSEQD